MKQNINAIKKARKERLRIARMHRMARKGISKDIIEEMLKNEEIRTAMCLVYGSYKIEDGTREKKITKRDEHHKVISTETVQVPNVLHGSAAAVHLFKQNGYTILASGANYVYLRIGIGDIDKVTELAKDVGRLSIYKLAPYKEHEDKPKKDKKPSANKGKAAAAKKTRKDAKKYYAEMRPYYAARRDGKISDRIKRFNPELAAKIQEWLKDHPMRETRKNKGKGSHSRGVNKTCQITTLEKKRQERLKKAARHSAKVEAKKASDRTKMVENAKKKKDLVSKKYPKQTELKAA